MQSIERRSRMDESMELEVKERLLKERKTWDDLIELYDSGDLEKLRKKLEENRQCVIDTLTK